MRKALVPLLVLFLCAPAARAQDSLWVLPRFEGRLVLDGMPDEPGWERIPPVPVVQYEPVAGAPATERTEIRFAYNDDYFFASIRAYDRDPDGIRVNTLYRDRLSGDDHFEFLLDTFNDNETAIVFTTTPAGIRRESAITNDASGGSISEGGWINANYNTYWDVETQITDAGWFAEVRIPLSSLRFQDEQGRVEMGLSVQRKIARRTERLVFPAVAPTANWAFLKPSRAQKIVMQGIYPETPLYVTPYVLGGVGQANVLNDAETAFVRDTDLERDLGLDLKYSLTNNLTLDATVNTDFAQVEADDQQVNLTRFSLFYPEKRQFFQERAGLFEFRTGGLSRLFHSRRIGLTEAGQPVPIVGGARITGRIGAWDVGALDMQTLETGPLPSENFGVLRLRRQAFNAYSYAGALVTSRIGVDGTYNAAYGVDGLFRIFGDDFLSLKWAQTFDHAVIDAGDLGVFNTGRLALAAQRRRRDGFGYDAYLIRSGPDYDPGMGFVQRRDFTQVDNTLSYTWMPGEASGLIWHTLQVRGAAFARNEDGSIESAEIEPAWGFAATSGSNGEVELEWHYEDLRAPFALSPDAMVPAGSYRFGAVGLEYNMPHTNLRQLDVRVEAGTFYDGWQASLQLTPTWYVSPHLELSGFYAYDRIRFPDREARFDAHIARLRVGTALDTQLSTNAFIQYSSTDAAFSANVRFRYNFREGNDLWIVFNEGLHTDRDYLTPHGVRYPRLDSRTLLIKYTYTLGV